MRYHRVVVSFVAVVVDWFLRVHCNPFAGEGLAKVDSAAVASVAVFAAFVACRFTVAARLQLKNRLIILF